MIQVENLTKRYGEVHAIDDVSFEVGKGEVVGFLGPNGAGKSTTMRILTGCIGATAGKAMIEGKDVLEAPKQVKRRIGYLPEVPPVYPSMTVRDYVRFAGSIKGVDDPAKAAEAAIGKVGLSKVAHRVIGHLSKGYRQRVGLAQALVHDPAVLVLDEPNSGLDPAQRKEIRELLAELVEGDRTVILSTHVLAEVEAICERVVVISGGKIAASDTIDNLAASTHSVKLRVARPDDSLVPALHAVEGVVSVETLADGTMSIGADRDVREALARVAIDRGLLELGAAQRLEDIYLRLTSGEANA